MWWGHVSDSAEHFGFYWNCSIILKGNGIAYAPLHWHNQYSVNFTSILDIHQKHTVHKNGWKT